MNRRSVLRLLGLAPIAAPAAVAAATMPDRAPIDYTAFASDVRDRLDSFFTFDGEALTIRSLRCQSRLEPQADGSTRFEIASDNFYVTSTSLPA